jgi:hypothetical protein
MVITVIATHYATTYKVPIKQEMAKLFCLSLKRKPDDDDVQVRAVYYYCKSDDCMLLN